MAPRVTRKETFVVSFRTTGLPEHLWDKLAVTLKRNKQIISTSVSTAMREMTVTADFAELTGDDFERALNLLKGRVNKKILDLVRMDKELGIVGAAVAPAPGELISS